MAEYFVLHVGRGTDGGFGDYSPPYWSEDPVSVDGRVIWFRTRNEADRSAAELNRASREAFWDAGHGGSYSGDFPVEYEVRRITVPESLPVGPLVGVTLIGGDHGQSWGEY